jgi:flagellar biosynthesis component FlhA
MSKKEKKDKKKDEEKKSKKKIKASNKIDNNEDLTNDVNNHLFDLFKDKTEVPSFIKNFVNKIQKQAGVEFQTVNIRVIGEDDLDTLPKEVLSQILDRAVVQEHYELASKVRDIINNKN